MNRCFWPVVPVILLSFTAMAKPTQVPTNLVNFKEVIWQSQISGNIDIFVKIGNFMLLRALDLHPPRAGINRTIRVRSKFRLPLSIECRVKRSSGMNLPGYVADWDIPDRHSKRSWAAKMPWGFSGVLKCGKLNIVVKSKTLTSPGSGPDKKRKEK